jgi:hypothetical protein
VRFEEAEADPKVAIFRTLRSLWGELPAEAQAALEESGFRKPKVKQVPVPPGLGASQQEAGAMSDGEQAEAIAALFEGADADTKRLMQLAGLNPPPSAPPTALEEIQAANKEYRIATQELRDLLLRRTTLKSKCDKLKGQYELALREFAEMADLIKAQEDVVQAAQSKLQAKADVPAPPLLPDLATIIQNAGITLTEDQRDAIARQLQSSHQVPQPSDERKDPADPQDGPAADIIRTLREDLRRTQEALMQKTQEAQALQPPVPMVTVEPPAGGSPSGGPPPKKAKVKDPDGNRSRSPKTKSQVEGDQAVSGEGQG